MTGYKNSHKKKLFAQEGQVAVIFALLIVCLLGMTALVIDLGSLYQKKGFYQTVADSAALAGAQELPESPEDAFLAAVDYAARNNVDIIYNCRDYTSEEVEISSTLTTYDTITITLSNREAPLYFARVFGMDTVGISAAATVMVGKPTQIYGVAPWAVIIPRGESWEDWLWEVAGEDREIRRNSTDFYAWGNVPNEPEGQWGAKYENWIINGYPNPLSTGDRIYAKNISTSIMNRTERATGTRIGGWSSPDLFEYLTYIDNDIIKLARSDTQFVMIPLVYNDRLPSSGEIRIEAFVPFIILRKTGSGSNTRIIGRFIHQAIIINEGEIEAVDSVGIRVIRLIR